MEEQDREPSASLPEELYWEEDDGWEDLPEEPSYRAFNKGIEAGVSSKGEPCSVEFLNELVHNLCLWNVQLVYFMDRCCDLDADLDNDTKTVVEHIYEAMDECNRLRLHPELFISEGLRIQFLAQVASLSEEIMVPLGEVAHKMDFLTRTARLDTTKPRKERVRKVGGIYYRVRNPTRPDPEGLHRSNTDRKPWNKWLNNRVDPAIGIEQRIPDTGHKMLRKTQYMYKCIEKNFQKSGRIQGEHKDTAFLARATGEDYSTLLTPPTHPHLNVPLNYHTDVTSQMSNNGAVKLEAISTACACFQRRELVAERTGMMCESIHRN